MSALVEVTQADGFEVLPAPWQDRHQANERLDAFLMARSSRRSIGGLADAAALVRAQVAVTVSAPRNEKIIYRASTPALYAPR